MNLMEQKMINLTKIDGCPAFLLYCTDTAALPPSFTPLTLNQEIEIVDDSELKVILQNGGCSKPIIYPASCLSLSPITADLRMDAAVYDANLSFIIRAAMPSGKAGWKCEAEDIKEFNASGYGIGDDAFTRDRGLQGLEQLTNLETLDLSNNPNLDRLTGIDTLENLQDVNLTGCTNLTALSELVSNENFSTGARLNVTNCTFSTRMCEDVACLVSKGVVVTGAGSCSATCPP